MDMLVLVAVVAGALFVLTASFRHVVNRSGTAMSLHEHMA